MRAKTHINLTQPPLALVPLAHRYAGPFRASICMSESDSTLLLTLDKLNTKTLAYDRYVSLTGEGWTEAMHALCQLVHAIPEARRALNHGPLFSGIQEGRAA